MDDFHPCVIIILEEVLDCETFVRLPSLLRILLCFCSRVVVFTHFVGSIAAHMFTDLLFLFLCLF